VAEPSRITRQSQRSPVEVQIVLLILFVVLVVASMWKVFEKAGQPGWAAIVPFYNMYVLTCKIAEKDALWFVLCFIPFVNIIIILVIYIEVANKFGQGALFGIGLFLLGFIFFPILAFGGAEYQGSAGAPSRKKAVFVEDEKW